MIDSWNQRFENLNCIALGETMHQRMAQLWHMIRLVRESVFPYEIRWGIEEVEKTTHERQSHQVQSSSIIRSHRPSFWEEPHAFQADLIPHVSAGNARKTAHP